MRRVALPLLLYAVPLAVFLWHVRIYDTAADDAYITFRYAHNLARGIGPVWNPGERVEGYSNFLWMILLALANAITRADIPTLARGLGILAGAGAIALAFELTARMARSLFWATVAAALVATSSAFAAHAPNGLESSMFALCILFVAFAVQRGSDAMITLALVAVSTCRFEGALVVALAGLAVVMGGVTSEPARRFYWGALAWAPIYGAWHLWRHAYYHWWTPNSVAAKEGGSPDIRFTQGIAYVKAFFETDKLITVALLLGAFAIVLRLARRRRASAVEPALIFLLLTSFVYMGFVVAIAGCWMPGWRMMAHVVPAIAVFGCVAASWIGMPRIVKAAVALACAWFGWKQVSVVSAEESLAPATTYWRDEVFALGEMGAWLERTTPRDAVVATMAAGALPYYATHVRCLDVLGLTNEHIARFGNKDPKSIAGHISTDWPWVVFQQRPDVWVSTAGGGFSKTPEPHIDRRFMGYATVVFEFTKTKNPQGRYMSLMLRPDRAAQLLQAFRADPDVVVVSTDGMR